MKKGFFLFILYFVLAFAGKLAAHPWDPAEDVIITTDGGMDDLRALTLMLADPSVRVTAIIATDGVLTARDTWHKVKSLLARYHHEGILVGLYHPSSAKAHGCPAARTLSWGPWLPQGATPLPADTVVARVFRYLPSQITWISLGSLATARHMLVHQPGFRKKVSRILWSADGEHLQQCFNYLLDTAAYQFVRKSEVPFMIVCGPAVGTLYDPALIHALGEGNNVYAPALTDDLKHALPLHGELCDDGLYLYLADSTLFVKESEGPLSFRLPSTAMVPARQQILAVIRSSRPLPLLILDHLPTDTTLYREDVRPIVAAALRRYGREEWRAGLITGELHRHLGIFSIIGMKMGIRAREYFGVGPDALHVTSCAGSQPPLSCMNDGLQASTGATPGHGLLTVTDTLPAPCAHFSWLGQTVTLRLNAEIAREIFAYLRKLREQYGLESDEYWDLLREFTLRKWLELDRHQIFKIIPDDG